MQIKKEGAVLKHRLLAALLSVALLFQMIAPMSTPMSAQASTAAGVGTINASITDADNGAVSLSGTNDLAQMSWASLTNHIANIYTLKISVTNMPTTTTNTLSVALPLGMVYKYPELSTYLAQAGQFANDVNVAASTKTAVGLSSADGYDFLNGTFNFVLNRGVQATTVYIPISFDTKINTDTITNAITVKLSNSAGAISDVLEKVTRTADTGSLLYHPSLSVRSFSAGTVITPPAVNRNIDPSRSTNPAASLVTKVTAVLHVSDPRAVIVNTDTTGNWALDSSDVSNGNYTLTFTPPGGVYYASRQGDDPNAITLPYAIQFPASAGWAVGDSVTLTYATGTGVTYEQYDVNNPVGNTGSTISAAHSFGPIISTYPQVFRYLDPGEKVYVNYANPAIYLGTTSNPSNGSISFSSDIDCANPDPAINDETGVLGMFNIGNAGATDSAPKNVDIHFDSTAYGVLSAYLPYTPGATLTSVSYKTTAQTVWQTKTVNIAARSFGLVYLSYMDLGLNTNRAEFITDISYNLGVIPANSWMSNSPILSNSNAQANYFGKWLGPNDLTTSGVATIRVYDASGTAKDTGMGSVITTRRNGNNLQGMFMLPDSTVAAGDSLSFISSIGSYGNCPNENSTIENPEIYIRSQIIDENGTPLPLNNIVIKNGPAQGGIDLTNYCKITNWPADENGDGQADVIIYKIDTSDVPDGLGAIMGTYISKIDGRIVNTFDSSGDNSSIRLWDSSYDISYSISTTVLTPTQSYLNRNMIFVRDPNANANMLSSGSRLITAASEPKIYSSISDGIPWTTGMVFGPGPGTTTTYGVNSIQAMLATAQIKQKNGTDWLSWESGDDPI
ncbi:MAG: hypothetical protein FWC54_00150, partial [Actinomycetia bacterium]|nr:hypothetical protein [Actinomycetes bacterium]